MEGSSMSIPPQAAVRHREPHRMRGPKVVYVTDDSDGTCYVIHQPKMALPPAAGRGNSVPLCRAFSQTGQCERGRECTLAHIPREVLAQCETTQVHNNIAWKNLEDVPYRRHAPGISFAVLRPSNTRSEPPGGTPLDLPSEYVLVTKGSQHYLNHLTSTPPIGEPSAEPQRPYAIPQVCAHYYINRCCRLGSMCKFIHYVYVDERAKPGQKAKARSFQPQVGSGNTRMQQPPPGIDSEQYRSGNSSQTLDTGSFNLPTASNSTISSRANTPPNEPLVRSLRVHQPYGIVPILYQY